MSRAARNCIQMSGQLASLWAQAPGEELFVGCVARASQGSHMLPTSWGTGHWPSWQPDAPRPVHGDRGTWLLSSLPSSCPVSPSAPESTVPGLCQQAARLHCPSGPGHWPGWTSALPQPPQSGHPWPPGAQWQGEPEPGKGHTLPCTCQVAEHPWHGLPGIALITEASQGRPPGPCLARTLCARWCLLRLREGGKATADDAPPVGEGGGQPLPLAHDVPPGMAEVSSLPCRSRICRLWQREKPERLSHFTDGTVETLRGWSCLHALWA